MGSAISAAGDRMRVARIVFLLWACFIARGAFYCAILPLWEGFDEYAHFGYVQYITTGRGWLVLPGAGNTREVERSMALVPMPWTLRSDAPPHDTQESYWRLPADERQSRERELMALPHSMAGQDAAGFVPIESQQPPLNYWLMAAFYPMLAGLSLPARVGALRLLNVLLASVAVPAVWITARRTFDAIEGSAGGSRRVATAVTAVLALMPEVFFDAARVANSGLSLFLYSLLAVLCLRILDGKRGAVLWAGGVLGLGLLSKAFFLAAVPVAAGAIVWAILKGRARVQSAMASLGLAAAISGWWYVRNLRVTGSLSGVLQDAALRHLPIAERLRHIPDVNWRAALDSTFLSHIWFGDWSFLQLRAWIYHVFALLAVVALAGLVVAWARHAAARGALSTLAAIYGFFCAGLAYHVLITYLANGISSTAGWYLCALAVPETVLAAAGLRALAPPRIRAYVVGGVALAFALLDLYGMLFVALPYYTGVIGHRPNGSLESFHWTALAHTGFGEVLRRLAVNKAAAVGQALIAAGGCAYLAATGTLAALGLTAEARGHRRRPSSRMRKFEVLVRDCFFRSAFPRDLAAPKLGRVGGYGA